MDGESEKLSLILFSFFFKKNKLVWGKWVTCCRGWRKKNSTLKCTKFTFYHKLLARTKKVKAYSTLKIKSNSIILLFSIDCFFLKKITNIYNFTCAEDTMRMDSFNLINTLTSIKVVRCVKPEKREDLFNF